MEDKILVENCYDAVFFTVDAVNVDINGDIWDQFNTVINDEEYKDHIELVFDNYIDAKTVARQLVKYDSKYNFSVVSLMRYTENEETSEEECLAADEVAHFLAATPLQINEHHIIDAKNNDKYKIATNNLSYYWNDFSIVRDSDLAEVIENSLENHDYDTFIRLWYKYNCEENSIRLPSIAVDENNEEFDITIKENFDKITFHEYEWG